MSEAQQASPFSRDPEALAWARGAVERVRDKYRRFQVQCEERGDMDAARSWKQRANLLDMDLIGGTGCVHPAFDERLPGLLAQIEARDRVGSDTLATDAATDAPW